VLTVLSVWPFCLVLVGVWPLGTADGRVDAGIVDEVILGGVGEPMSFVHRHGPISTETVDLRPKLWPVQCRRSSRILLLTFTGTIAAVTCQLTSVASRPRTVTAVSVDAHRC
jgi:hypothetical protein